MRKLRLFYLFVVGLFAVACSKEEITSIGQQGDYIANFDFPIYDVYAPGKVVITNRSKNADKFLWEYEGGKTIIGKDTLDVSTSEKIVPDTIFYELPGQYNVKLTTWQGNEQKTISKTILIEKQQPEIIVPANIGVYLDVVFSARAFRYPGVNLSYSWDFGEAGTSTEATPTVRFVTEGEHLVKLTVNDGQETLSTEVTINVMGELTTSLYFTDMVTGRLFRYAFKKLSDPTLNSYQVSLGRHPMAMQVYNNRVYIADAGNNIYFAASAPGDGRIFSVDLAGNNEIVLGTSRETVAAGYQSDPFNFVIDPNTNMLFYLSRNFNVKAIPVTATEMNLATNPQRMAITAANAGVTSVFNWIDGGIQIVGGELWYSKQANGKGLYKFNIANNTFVGRLTAFDNFSIRNFVVDQVHNKIYFVLNNAQGTYQVGLYKSNMDGSGIEMVDNLSGHSLEGSGTEITYVTSMALDVEPDGYLYYGFRSSTDVSNNGTIIGNGSNSGIKRYKLDGSEAPNFLLKGYIPYGVALDHVKR